VPKRAETSTTKTQIFSDYFASYTDLFVNYMRFPAEDGDDHDTGGLESSPPHWGQIAPSSSTKRGKMPPRSKNTAKLKPSVFSLGLVSWAAEACSVRSPCGNCRHYSRVLGVRDVASLAVLPTPRPRLAACQAEDNPALRAGDD